MIKLYYSPGACSLAAHIILEELKIPYQAIKVDLKTHTVDGQDYYKINPSGAVPALIVEDGKLLTQNAAVLMYLGDSDPSKHLIPKCGTFERVRCYEWIGLVTADVHKSFGPLFSPHKFVDSENAVQELKQHAAQNVTKSLLAVEKKLQPTQFVLGKEFSIIDAYLFVFYRWAKYLQIPLDNCPNYLTLMQRVAERASVQAALKMEGLI